MLGELSSDGDFRMWHGKGRAGRRKEDEGDLIGRHVGEQRSTRRRVARRRPCVLSCFSFGLLLVIEDRKGQHSLFIFVGALHVQGLVAVGIWSFGVF